MAERLLLYHVLLWSEHRSDDKSLSVRSCVVSLWKKAKVDPSPLLWTQPGEPLGLKAERVRFSYEVVQMWEKRPEDLLGLGHAALYPLLPLTKGGATQKIVKQMLDLLSGEQHLDFAVIGFLFATRTFQIGKQYSDLVWLKERFRHMHDFLRESPAYE